MTDTPGKSTRKTEAAAPGDHAALEERLGHRFANRKLLAEALTHSSVTGKRSNERLEFLGDRVLGLVIAQMLTLKETEATEGELAPRLNALVRRETCADVALRSGIAEHLQLAAGERQSGGAAKGAILADACEAVIAALYLDGGLEAARAFIARYWQPLFEGLDDAARDAKTALQEWAQGRPGRKALPVYRVVERSGPDHAPRFVIEVDIEGAGSARGEGASKREAEREAAVAMLKRLGHWSDAI